MPNSIKFYIGEPYEIVDSLVCLSTGPLTAAISSKPYTFYLFYILGLWKLEASTFFAEKNQT